MEKNKNQPNKTHYVFPIFVGVPYVFLLSSRRENNAVYLSVKAHSRSTLPLPLFDCHIAISSCLGEKEVTPEPRSERTRPGCG